MIELRSESVDDTRAIAATIAAFARAGDLIVLAGQMGAGKTAFAQGFAREIGVREPVTSPTYTLVHSYPAVRQAKRARTGAAGGVAGADPDRTANVNPVTVHHADLYRLEHTAEVADLALAELLEDDAIVLVEWGDMADLGPHLQIEIRADDDDADGREVTLTCSDRRWDARWDRLTGALQGWAA
jgi:tRNA threonylcarbamoyladenosine biosynthesis protein TsaE